MTYVACNQKRIMSIPLNLYHKLPRSLRRFIRKTKQIIRIALRMEKRFVKIDNYYIQCHFDIEQVYHEDSQLFYATPRYDVQDVSKSNNALLLHGGILKFRSASCFAGSDIIQLSNGKLWYELRDLYQDIHKACNCSDNVILLNDEKNWYQTKQCSQVKYIEKGFFLSGIFSSNYYHFIVSILPKLRWLHSVPIDVPLLVDRNIEKYDSYKQLLSYCNVENRSILFLDEQIQYEVDNLYCATIQMMARPNYWLGQHMAVDDDLYNQQSMYYVRNMVLQHLHMIDGLPKRCFISRKNASGIRKFNEAECIEALKPFGFKVVYPELMSIDEQAALFSQAECIVGGSGAAFTNLLFASDKTNAIILEGYQSGICIFSSIAHFVNANLLYLYSKNLGAIPNGNYLHVDFTVNIDDLITLVHQLLHSIEKL